MATVVGGLASVDAVVAGLARPGEALLCLCLAALGGYLPDVDADNSAPLKSTFHWGAVALAFLALFHSAPRYSLAELALLWVCVYLLLRVVAVKVFEKLTVHRGLFHSVPAALLFSSLAVVICHRGFQREPNVAWAAGGFLFVGYLSHLLMDELEGLNLFGVGTRKSLGSACKLWSRANPHGTLWLYALSTGLLLGAPSPTSALAIVADPATYKALADSLLPQADWFTGRPHP